MVSLVVLRSFFEKSLEDMNENNNISLSLLSDNILDKELVSFDFLCTLTLWIHVFTTETLRRFYLSHVLLFLSDWTCLESLPFCMSASQILSFQT